LGNVPGESELEHCISAAFKPQLRFQGRKALQGQLIYSLWSECPC